MSKILCAALLLVLSAGTSAEGTGEEAAEVIVGGPAPLVGGIEARPLGSLEPCDHVAFAERSKCLQQVADGPGTSRPLTLIGLTEVFDVVSTLQLAVDGLSREA